MAKMCTAGANEARELTALGGLNCDILMVNFYREIVFASYYEIPQPIKIMRAVSDETKSLVTLCAKLRIEEDSFYSVVVFDKGMLLGISDSLTGGQTRGKSLKIYSTEFGKIAVCVGKDFLCPQSENGMCAGADFILHHTHDGFGCEYMCAVKGHAVFGTRFVGLYSDAVIKCDGRTECEDIGKPFEFKATPTNVKPPISFLKLSIIE